MKIAQTRMTLAAVALLAGVSAQAATWNKVTSGGTCATVNSASCTINATTDAVGAGTTATLTGWANAPSGTATSGTGAWRAANLTNQGTSGVGVNHGNGTADPGEGGSPEHAVDNDGYVDAVRLQFGASTALGTVKFGWTGGDGDFTLLRWVGNGILGGGAAGGMTHWGLVGNTATDTDAAAAGWSGWQLVGNYSGESATVSGSEKTHTVNAGGLTSSYWLVLAYNSAFGTGTNLSNTNDAFKLLQVTSRKAVSEPSVLLLAAGGVAALVLRRRRRQA